MITLKMNKRTLNNAEVIDLFGNLTKTNKNILYVNQCNSNVYLVEHLIKKTFSSSVYTIDSYDDALTILRTFKMDMVIIDVDQPGAMTIDFMQKLKAQSKAHIPLLLINNQNIVSDYEAAFGVKFDELIVKPVAVDDFLQKVAGLLH